MLKSICLGVIGGGQLGSLLCSAAKKLKVKTVVLSDDKDAPARNFCDQFINSKYDDNAKVREFISKVDVVTYEFENIPVDFLNLIQREKKVLPSPNINKIAQNRKLEKTFVNELGINTTDWAFIKSAEDIKKNQHLLPGILKSNTLGYDGKGQYILNSLDDIKQDWRFSNDYILEKKVDILLGLKIKMYSFLEIRRLLVLVLTGKIHLLEWLKKKQMTITFITLEFRHIVQQFIIINFKSYLAPERSNQTKYLLF